MFKRIQRIQRFICENKQPRKKRCPKPAKLTPRKRLAQERGLNARGRSGLWISTKANLKIHPMMKTINERLQVNRAARGDGPWIQEPEWLF